MYTDVTRYMGQYEDAKDESFFLQGFIDNEIKRIEKYSKEISSFETELVQLREFQNKITELKNQLLMRIESLDHTLGLNFENLVNYYKEEINDIDKALESVEYNLNHSQKELWNYKKLYSNAVNSLNSVHRMLNGQLSPELREKYISYLPEGNQSTT